MSFMSCWTTSISTRTKLPNKWLLRHPRVHFHYTATHASWMNMIECFFSILTRQALTQSVQRSKKDLKDFLLRYLKKYSENPTPFTWTKGPDQCNESSKRLRSTGQPIPDSRSGERARQITKGTNWTMC